MVNFDLSQEAKDVRRDSQRFLIDQSPLSRLRAVAADDRPFDADIWQKIVALGWPGVAVAEKYGGSAMGYESLCALVEQVGATLMPAPLISTLGAIEALLLAGSEQQQAHWIPALVSGACIGTVAIAEHDGNPDQRGIKTRVSGGTLSGVKRPVVDGGIANLIIVAARDDLRPGLFVVEANEATLVRKNLTTLDLGRTHSELRFCDAVCEELTGCGSGWPLVQRLLDRLAMICAFEQLGGASACLDMAVAHAKQRIAFGRPIGSFQAIKHKLADLYVAIELARSNAYYGAWALENQRDEAVAASSARVSATEAFDTAARENIHIHGGQGFAWEQDCHLYLRRSRMLSSALGAAAYWKERLVASIDSPATLGAGCGL